MSATLTGHRCHSIYLDLLRQIEAGSIAEGERLPRQLDLAEHYGASVTTINKVIARLQDEKRVWSRRGAGVFVEAAPETPQSSGMISYMYMFGNEDLVPLQNAALANGCLLSVYSQLQTAWNSNAERLFLQQVRDQRHRALLAFCSPLKPRNDDLLREVADAGVRVIHLEHYRPELPDEEYLLPDYQRAARMAAVDAALAGYEQIFFYGYGRGQSPACLLQHRGLHEALDDHGVPLADEYTLLPPGHDGDMQAMLARVPANSALILHSSNAWQHFYEVFGRRGLRVPEDIGLIAIEAPGEARAPVDTLSFRRLATTERAMRMVGADQPPVHELVRPVRVLHGSLRESSGDDSGRTAVPAGALVASKTMHNTETRCTTQKGDDHE